MSLEYIYNILYKLSNRINLFVPLGIIIGFTILLILFLRLKRYINPLKKAISLQNRGNYVRALVYADLFLEKHPTSKKALLLKADIQAELGLFDRAEGNYFKVMYMKSAGDGIDVHEIKKKLLKVLYEQDKIYQTFELSREILSIDRNCAEALFYLALIYIGQLYFREADKILKRLISNRPGMHEAYFVQSINYAQLRMYEDALISINRAIEISDGRIYHLIKSAICYFNENYILASEVLNKLPNSISEYKLRKQYIFYLKLNSMVNYRLGYFDRAALGFKMAIPYISKSFQEQNNRKEKAILKEKRTVVYGENGKIRNINSTVTGDDSNINSMSPYPKKSPKINPVEEYERKMGLKKRIAPEIEEYLRLKEVAIEEGKTELVSKKSFNDPFQLLDIDGLTENSWIHVSYGFSLVKAKNYREAVEFFKKLRKDRPEIIGLKRVIELINEKIEDSNNNSVNLEYLREKSEKLMDKKKKRYELWEYIQEWERRIIKPFELIEVSGYSTKKRLNPTILFKKDTKFTLDF